MPRPRIAITAHTSTGDDTTETVVRAYVDAVVTAGGLPVLLPILPPELAAEALADVDGLVLTGGADVDPARYGGAWHPEVYGVDAGRDEWEQALARTVTVPVLGICRGMQLLNVAAGGTLVAHLPDVTEQPHREKERGGELVHEVAVTRGSRLHAVVGGLILGVNTLHHQAVDRVGAGFSISAMAPDGTVEAIEARDRPVIGVQWHPELLPGHDGHASTFGWLVAAADAKRIARAAVSGVADAVSG